jgi:Leucine-rich repeat (LRR) protein
MLSALVLLAIVGGISACPTRCECSREWVRCNHSEIDVRAVLEEVSSWQSHPSGLSFDSCKPIGVLEKLPRLDSVEIVSIVRSGITAITMDAFDDVPSLKTLLLFQNNITSLQWWVPASVVRLDLRANSIPNVPRRTFFNNNRLEHLLLNGNPIAYISSHAFDKPHSQLYELSLSGTELLHFPARFFKKNSVSQASAVDLCIKSLVLRLCPAHVDHTAT